MHLVCPASNDNTPYGRACIRLCKRQQWLTHSHCPYKRYSRTSVSPIQRSPFSGPTIALLGHLKYNLFIYETPHSKKGSPPPEIASKHIRVLYWPVRSWAAHAPLPQTHTWLVYLQSRGRCENTQPTRCRFVAIVASWPTSLHLALLQVFPRILVTLKLTKHACLGRLWFHLSFSKASQPGR